MVDNKSKTCLIRHLQKNKSLMKINNIILMLRTRIILSSLFVLYFYCICHSGSFSVVLFLVYTDKVCHTANYSFIIRLYCVVNHTYSANLWW